MTMTQADLKMLVRYGAARDITTSGTLPKGSYNICKTTGKYGLNGALFVSKTGKLYAITERGGNLFNYV